MTPASPLLNLAQVPVLLRGETRSIAHWIRASSVTQLLRWLLIICVCTGMFGAVAGYWRAPLQAVYGAIKFPLVIILTTVGNALLNGMLAPLLGLNIGFRQSFQGVLMSFTITSVILGGFSPLLLFMVWNTPPLSQFTASGHSVVLVSQVLMIAVAGIAAHVRLLELLQELSGSVAVGRKVLVAWLAGNLFLGSQISWVLRPFIGSPGLPVRFLREDAFHGSFYEAFFRSFVNLIF